jgi:hypothetical protein
MKESIRYLFDQRERVRGNRLKVSNNMMCNRFPVLTLPLTSEREHTKQRKLHGSFDSTVPVDTKWDRVNNVRAARRETESSRLNFNANGDTFFNFNTSYYKPLTLRMGEGQDTKTAWIHGSHLQSCQHFRMPLEHR